MVPVLMLAVVLTGANSFGDQISMQFDKALGPVVSSSNIPKVNNVYACPYQFSFGSDGTGIAGGLDNTTYNAFCIDTNDNIKSGASVWQVQSLSGFLGTTVANEISNMLYDASQNFTVKNSLNQTVSVSGINFFPNNNPAITNPITGKSNTPIGPTSSTMSTGLSLAIWALLDNISSVNASVSGDPNAVTSAVANTLLHEATTSRSAVGGLYALTQQSDQNQMIITVGPLSSTPEPRVLVGLASLACCCLPIGARAVVRRRRQA